MSTLPLTLEETLKTTRSGGASAEAMVNLAFDRITRANDRLKAFVHLDRDRALEDARHLDRLAALGTPKGALFGVPIAIKDIIHVAGMPTGGGSLTRKGSASEAQDAVVVQRLKNAGSIIIGKVATVEYAFGGWGSNETVGAPVNPWDLKHHRVPGGSSSGSGVAVASGMIPGALGSDTGGSIRLPSSFAGMVGLKTTAGLIPTTGVLPLSPMLDTIGPMTRTVRDAALLFDVLTEQVEGTSVPSSLNDSKAFEGKRIGIPEDLGVKLHPHTEKIWQETISRIKNAGAILVPVRFPKSLADYAAPCGMFLAVDGYRNYRDFADEDPNRLGEAVRRRMISGKSVTATDYLENLVNRDRNKAAIAKSFEIIDALLTPTTAFPAPVLGEHPEHDSPAVFTRFANYFELAAISLPAGVTSEGLPVGMQFIVPGFQEARALDLAYRLERSLGGPILCPHSVS
jgi:aspartyl-tRNA(Asn)/glutamyl-tRNA(Gln) amidotransferase subunit A